MKGFLAIKDIGVFSGKYIGWQGPCTGEIVRFQSIGFCWDILTDPSYKKKIVITESMAVEDRQPEYEEIQSFMPHLEGIVFLGSVSPNGNGSGNSRLFKYLESNKITGFVPDRKDLLKDVLEFASLTTGGIDLNREDAESKSRTTIKLSDDDLKTISVPEEFLWDLTDRDVPVETRKVVVWDFGANYNLLRSLRRLGCQVRVAPPNTKPEDIVALHPDGVVIAGGSAAAKIPDHFIPRIERMIGIRPFLGVGGGAALLAMALGMKTKTLLFPHFGNSIPVEDTKTGKVESSYQTHAVAIDPASARSSGAVINSINVCDASIEGFSMPDYEAVGSFCLPTPDETPEYIEKFLKSLSSTEAKL